MADKFADLIDLAKEPGYLQSCLEAQIEVRGPQLMLFSLYLLVGRQPLPYLTEGI